MPEFWRGHRSRDIRLDNTSCPPLPRAKPLLRERPFTTATGARADNDICMNLAVVAETAVYIRFWN